MINVKEILFILLFTYTFSTMAQKNKHTDEELQFEHQNPINSSAKNKKQIRQFLTEVRSGKSPDHAGLYMADTLLAHQLNAEEETTVKRTPQNYAEHINEFLTLYGDFHFEITELIAEDDRVYARWKQTGKHMATIDGHPATGKPIIEIASAVYRLENGKIKEYWIQIDRLGLEKQL